MILSNLDDYTQALLKAVIRGSRLLHADKALEMYSIENRHAAIFWLTDSRWCVKENPWIEEYLVNGPLILLQSLRRSRDYLLAPADGEFRNRRNKRVSLRHFIAHHESAAAPLRRIGVYWHSAESEGDWAEQICYCVPNGNSHHLTHQMRDSASKNGSK